MNLLLVLITSSIVGSAVFLTLLLIRPITGKIFSKSWHYYCLFVPLVFLLGGTHIAVSLTGLIPNLATEITSPVYTPQEMPIVAPQEVIMPSTFDNLRNVPMHSGEADAGLEISPTITSQLISHLERAAPFLLAFWILGAIIFIVISTKKYLQYRSIVLHNAKSVTDIDCKIPIVTSAAAHTPMLLGVVRPIIVLPNMYLADEEMEMVLAHEMVHYRRKDLFVKLLMLVANAMHWFNPAVYVLNQQLNTACELSCDEKVVSEMDTQNRRFYGETILQVLQHSTIQRSLVSNVVFATNLCNSRKNFKRRLISMMNTKKMKKSIVALALATGLLVVGGGFAISSMVGSALPVQAFGLEREFDLNVVVTPGEDPMGQVLSEDITSSMEGGVSAEEAAQLLANAVYHFFGRDISEDIIQMSYRMEVEAGLTVTAQMLNHARVELVLQEALTATGLSLDDILDYISPFFQGPFDEYTGTVLSGVEDPIHTIGLLSVLYIRDREVDVVNGWATSLEMEADQLFEHVRNFDRESLSLAAARLDVDADEFIQRVSDVWWMVFNSWESLYSPSIWVGQVQIADAVEFAPPIVGFTIDATTGELMSINYNPSAEAMSQVEPDFSASRRDELTRESFPAPTDADNNLFANLAMDTVETLGLGEVSDIEKARIHDRRIGVSGNSASANIMVHVIFEDGQALELGFTHDDRQLVSLSTQIFEWSSLNDIEGITFDWVTP